MPYDTLTFDLENLAVDVFTLEDSGSVIESLTGFPAGAGPIASAPCSCSCSGMCSLIK